MNAEMKFERVTEYSNYILELLRKSFEEVSWSEKELKEFLGNKANILLVARREDAGAGLIRAHLLPRYDSRGPEILLHEMDVMPAFQRQGIALALIEELKKIGKDLGASEIWVLTNDSNKAAMGLYAKAGMTRQNQDDVMFSMDLRR